jgi:enoyl-CoA hydratase
MRYFNYLSGAIGFLEPWTRNWIVDYKLEGEVAVLTFDNGKANAVSHALIDSLYEGFDRAEKEAKAIVMIGRPGIFSGGFDLKEIQQGPEAAAKLVARGAHLFHRMFALPMPLVAGCTGHAIATGGFLLLACDSRIGAEGDFRIGLNETAIGMTLPVFGL